jgi:RNA polymerase sigma-70 factor (ECF subfamily)
MYLTMAAQHTDVLALTSEEAQKLVERHRQPIYRLALRLLNDSHEAEDVTQEVLLQLCRTRGSLAPGSDEGAWAYSIAINRCRDILRSMRHRVVTLTPEMPDDEDWRPTPDLALHQAREELRVRNALQRLQPSYRTVLILRDLEGQPYRRMCEILKLSETTLKARVIRARRALARALAEEESSDEERGRK